MLRPTINAKSREIRGHSFVYIVLPMGLMGAEGLETTPENAGETALSEKPGAQTGAIDSDSDLQTQLRDELQQAWQTFGRLDLQTDLAAKRKALWRIRDRFSKLMNEIEALR